MTDNDHFFVRVRSPVDIRRALLESTKQTIDILQRYEHFKAIRVQKTEVISQLKHQTKELQLLFAKLKKELPKTGLRVKLKQEEKESKSYSAKEGPKSRRSDLAGLESELREIEGKLNALK